MKSDYRYHYSPLASQNAIRLVELFPGKLYERIRCSISHHQLDEAPPFEALSYTWKDYDWPDAQPFSRGIFSGPGELGWLPVAPNCAVALRRLRRRNAVRTLWIDCICINQMDTTEKELQIAIMPQIYAKAWRVVIFLGEDADGSQLVMEMAQNEAWTGGRRGSRNRPDNLQEWELAVVRAFISRRWFTRVWILQEIFHAQEAIILCGDQKVDWKKFSRLFFLNFDIIMGSSLSINIPRVMRMNSSSRHRPALLTTLQFSRHCSATDPRDMIYALLGMSDIPPESVLRPDYSKSTKQVYEEAAELMLRQSGLRLLSHVQGRSTIADLPSWVPDWSQSPEHVPLAQIDEEVMQWTGHRRSIAGEKEPTDMEVINADPAPMLRIRGFRLAKISQVGQQCQRLEFYWKDVLESWLDLGTTKLNHSDPHQAKDAFARAILPFRSASLSQLERLSDNRRHRWQLERFFKKLRNHHNDYLSQQRIEREVRRSIIGRRLIVTESGDIGLGTLRAQAGDLVCIFLGGQTPFVLRPYGDETYELIGEGIIGTVMLGEVTQATRQYEDFILR